MRALITGGAGFIGSHLAESLLERGDQVVVIDNLTTGRFENVEHLVDHPQFRFAIDTVTNKMVMDRLTSECDVVFHLAAAVGVELIIDSPVHTIETNILGTHAVLEAAHRYRKRVLIASTSEIYGKNTQVPFGEDDDRHLGPTTKARWSYATSKAVDEFLGLAYYREKGLPVVTFRLFNTVGPRQSGRYGMVVPRFVQQALAREPITVYGDGQQTRCFCDVADAVRAIIGLGDEARAIGDVFNVGSTDELSILDLARMVLREVDATRTPVAADSESRCDDDRIVFVPYDEAYEVGFEDMRRRVPDTTRIRELLGWQPKIKLRETLQRVIDFESAQ
jgi:UDP-glucose 4-epimerase